MEGVLRFCWGFWEVGGGRMGEVCEQSCVNCLGFVYLNSLSFVLLLLLFVHPILQPAAGEKGRGSP